MLNAKDLLVVQDMTELVLTQSDLEYAKRALMKRLLRDALNNMHEATTIWHENFDGFDPKICKEYPRDMRSFDEFVCEFATWIDNIEVE